VSLFRYFDFRVTARPRRVHGSDDTVHKQASIGLVDSLKRRRPLKVRSCTREQISAARKECYMSVMEIYEFRGQRDRSKIHNILSGIRFFADASTRSNFCDSLERGHTLDDLSKGIDRFTRDGRRRA